MFKNLFLTVIILKNFKCYFALFLQTLGFFLLMDLLSTLIITGIFFSPLIVSIVYFIKIIVKIPSIFVFQLLLADIGTLIWAFAGFPVLVHNDVFTLQELIIIEEIGVIFGGIGFIFLLFTFNRPYFGNKQIFLARVGIIAFAIIVGVKIALMIINNPFNSIYGLYIENGILKRYTNPFMSLIVLIAFSFLIIILFIYSYWQKKFPDYIISEEIKKISFYATYLMLGGVCINYLGLILPISLLGISNTLFFSSRIFITFSYILITLMVAKNPIITLKEQGNPNNLIEKGIVGWILSVNSDQGPEVKVLSTSSKNLYLIDERDEMLFAVASISIVGIGQNFVDTQFIIPFPMKEKNLSVICYSFNIFDPNLKDPRRSNIADVVYGIIIPNVFLNYLGNIGLDSFTITKKVALFESLQNLISEINFVDETVGTFRNLLLQKIT